MGGPAGRGTQRQVPGFQRGPWRALAVQAYPGRPLRVVGAGAPVAAWSSSRSAVTDLRPRPRAIHQAGGAAPRPVGPGRRRRRRAVGSASLTGLSNVATSRSTPGGAATGRASAAPEPHPGPSEAGGCGHASSARRAPGSVDRCPQSGARRRVSARARAAAQAIAPRPRRAGTAAPAPPRMNPASAACSQAPHATRGRPGTGRIGAVPFQRVTTTATFRAGRVVDAVPAVRSCRAPVRHHDGRPTRWSSRCPSPVSRQEFPPPRPGPRCLDLPVSTARRASVPGRGRAVSVVRGQTLRPGGGGGLQQPGRCRPDLQPAWAAMMTTARSPSRRAHLHGGLLRPRVTPWACTPWWPATPAAGSGRARPGRPASCSTCPSGTPASRSLGQRLSLTGLRHSAGDPAAWIAARVSASRLAAARRAAVSPLPVVHAQPQPPGPAA